MKSKPHVGKAQHQTLDQCSCRAIEVRVDDRFADGRIITRTTDLHPPGLLSASWFTEGTSTNCHLRNTTQAFVDRAMREEAQREQRDRRLSTLAYPTLPAGRVSLASVYHKAIVDAHQTWLEALSTRGLLGFVSGAESHAKIIRVLLHGQSSRAERCGGGAQQWRGGGFRLSDDYG